MRVIDSRYLKGGSGVSGSISDPRLAQGGWVSWQPAITAGDGFLNRGVVSPQFNITGGLLTWAYPTGVNGSFDTYQDGTFFYGAS
jgi:hypothetical protein